MFFHQKSPSFSKFFGIKKACISSPQGKRYPEKYIPRGGKWLSRTCALSDFPEQIHSISQTFQLIKGESSYWINKNKLTKEKFLWQDDYWAVGVSESHVDAVKNYIDQQESHHQKIPFSKEVDEFMEKYGWE